MTDAMPMPTPAMKRQRARSQALHAIADRIDETKKRTAPSTITCVRPHRSASLPPDHAPSAQPSRAIATTRPVTVELRSNCPSIASTAPLMTDESKPKRNPPTAAAIASAVAFRWALWAPA